MYRLTNNPSCPECRSSEPFTNNDNAMEMLLNEPAKCMNDKCKWKSTMRSYKQHATVCPTAKRHCPFYKLGCEVMLVEKEMKEHCCSNVHDKLFEEKNQQDKFHKKVVSLLPLCLREEQTPPDI